MMRFYVSFFVALISVSVSAQFSTVSSDIPLVRKSFHDKVDVAQADLLRADGRADQKFNPTKDDDLNQELTLAATKSIDDLQQQIESDSSLDNNNKIKFLRGLSEVVTSFAHDYHMHIIKASLLPDLLTAYKQSMQLEIGDKSFVPVITKNALEVGNILTKSVAFAQNDGAAEAHNILFLKNCEKNPDQVLAYLTNEPDIAFADSLISAFARYNQEDLYNYAAASNRLAEKIRNNNDPLVKVIAKMARMKSGRQYFPFLDDIYKGNITFEKIDAAMDDPYKYYRLLVQTEIRYADRVRLRDTPMAMSTLNYKIKKSGEYFINEINGLHESPDNIRFKAIEPLNPQELYYLAVLQEEEIYTSSYVRGVYPKIFQKMKVARGDSLLMSVRFDHFKKWIKMAANYNTLDNFLKTMDKENAELLMKAFVNGLDKNRGKDSLEDAVDVAGSFASINDKNLQNLILNQVQYNLKQANEKTNTRAINIYSVLNTLFLSMDSTNDIDVSKTLGIRPVYFMPVNDLKDTAGKIIIQQFFYGDKDGKNVFNAFLRTFTNPNWKITNAKDWVAVSSTHGTPVVIYSNRPLDEEKNLDAQAQANLSEYLFDRDLEPSVVIHRGHSYYVKSTIDQLAPSAKVILLGSCGGYQSLNTVLKICPEAQIISTKQTGAGAINLPLINGMVDNLRQGKNLDWPAMWKHFSNLFTKNDLFDDYVPPYKNLGATFIMAYRKQEQLERERETQE